MNVIGSRWLRGRPVLATAVATCAVCLAAGAPAGAESCWVEDRTAPTFASGTSAGDASVAALVSALSTAEALLKADPLLATIDGFRFFPRRSIAYIDDATATYTANVWVTLNAPDVWKAPGCSLDEGRADYLNTRAAEISFNEVGRILSIAGIVQDPATPPLANLAPEAVDLFLATGVLQSGNETLRAFRQDGRPVLVHWTVGEHLAFWERTLQDLSDAGGGEVSGPELTALRAHRAALSPQDLEAYAWMSADAAESHLWGYSEAGATGAVPMLSLAPDLLLPTVGGRGRIFLLVVSA